MYVNNYICILFTDAGKCLQVSVIGPIQYLCMSTRTYVRRSTLLLLLLFNWNTYVNTYVLTYIHTYVCMYVESKIMQWTLLIEYPVGLLIKNKSNIVCIHFPLLQHTSSCY